MQGKSSVSNGFSENDADMARILGVKGVIVGSGNRRVVGAQYAAATGARALEQGRRVSFIRYYVPFQQQQHPAISVCFNIPKSLVGSIRHSIYQAK